MTEENLAAGEYRKQIYKAVQDVIGRNLDKNEHAYISKILKEYVKAHAPTEPLDQKAIEHTYVCKNCGGKKIGYGRNFNQKMKRIKPPKENGQVPGKLS